MPGRAVSVKQTGPVLGEDDVDGPITGHGDLAVGSALGPGNGFVAPGTVTVLPGMPYGERGGGLVESRSVARERDLTSTRSVESQ